MCIMSRLNRYTVLTPIEKWFMVVVVGIALLFLATVLYASEDFTEVTEGTGKKLGTQTRVQGGSTVHDEVVVCSYNHSAGNPVSRVITLVNNTSTAAFTSPTACHSLIAVANTSNAGPVYFGYGTLSLANLGVPLYPGTRQQLRAAKVGDTLDCAGLSLLAVTPCSNNCQVFLQTQ